MTKQHVFGKRLLTLLQSKVGVHTIIERGPGKITSKRQPGNIWSKQVRRVCKKCNSGWMRLLEERAFEVLEGLIISPTNIMEIEQTTLASRLGLMVMCAALTIKDSLNAIYENDFKYFYETGLLPNEWLIYIGRADVPVEIGQYYNANVFGYTYSRPTGRPERGYSYVATFVLGKLCVHVLTRAPPNYRGYTGVKLARLWPATGKDIDLSRTSNMTIGMVAALAEAVRNRSIADQIRERIGG